MFLHISATNAKGRFFRAGIGFTKEGTVIHAGALDPKTLKRIKDGPHLKVRDATADEARPQVLNGLLAVIPQLDAKDFGAGGKPNLKALRDGSGMGELITEEVRDEAMEVLTAQGFVPPKAAAKT